VIPDLTQFGATTSPSCDESLSELIEVTRQLGLGYLEVKCEPGLAYPRELSSAEREELKRHFHTCGIIPTVHASFYDINLASLNPLIREASERQLLECLRLAYDLGAQTLVVHPGELPADYPLSLLPVARENLITGLRQALKLAKELGVALALENKARGRNRGLIQSPQDHLNLVEALNSTHCKVAFDAGHAHTWGFDLARYLKQVYPYLAEIHLHDNDGSGDQHLPLGAGTIDFIPLFKLLDQLGYRGPLILEMRSLRDLERSKEYLNHLRSALFPSQKE